MPAKSLTQWNQRLPDKGKKNQDGSNLKKHDPERYKAIVKAIKAGIALETLTDIFQTSLQTLQGITKKEDIQSDAQKNVVQELRQTRNMALDLLKQALQAGELKGKELGVVIGILTDKETQLEGRPGMTIRHERVDITHDTVQKLLAQLPQQGDVIEAEVVEEKEQGS